MDPKALFNIPCGVFILATKAGKKMNACIINTCIQVSSSPVRIAVSILNGNYTCKLIRASLKFSLSVLDKSATYDLISRFGFQNGRKADKFEGFSYGLDDSGNPYPNGQICAMISAKVTSTLDLGTHTLFIAEVLDARTMSSQLPITYYDYHKDIKPKPEIMVNKKIIGWKCRICGYVYDGPELPPEFVCPTCGHTAEDFEPIYKNSMVG